MVEYTDGDAANAKKAFEYKIPEMPAQPAANQTMGGKASKDGGKNLWSTILGDVGKRDDLDDSHLLLLGDRGSGKRSIIKEINNKYVRGINKKKKVEEMGSDFSALDFSFLYVKDLLDQDNLMNSVTVDDNQPKINIWSLHDSSQCELLESVLDPTHLQRTMAVIVLDLENPLKLMQSLRDWLTAINKCLFNIFPHMEEGVFEKMKQKIYKVCQTYEEPQFDDNGNLIKQRKDKQLKTQASMNNADDDANDMSDEDVRLDMDLPEGVLSVNLGIPIIIVCNKIDVLQQGAKAKII